MTRKPKGVHGFENRDYTADEADFIKAMDTYQRQEEIRFPAKTDYFHVLTVVLGYEKPECSKKTT